VLGKRFQFLAQELNAFLTPITKAEMIVDRSKHDEQLRINFNISFPALSCEFATLDVSDALGLVCPPALCQTHFKEGLNIFMVQCVLAPLQQMVA